MCTCFMYLLICLVLIIEIENAFIRINIAMRVKDITSIDKEIETLGLSTHAWWVCAMYAHPLSCLVGMCSVCPPTFMPGEYDVQCTHTLKG